MDTGKSGHFSPTSQILFMIAGGNMYTNIFLQDIAGAG